MAGPVPAIHVFRQHVQDVDARHEAAPDEFARGEFGLSSAQQRVAGFRELLGHARDRLGLEVGFVLWDRSTVPAGLAPDAFAIRIADEGAVAALLRRPSIETVGHLWVARRIEEVNGTLFDVANVRRTKRTRDFL